jgi:human immunodeficiency virus type I enhancer-binding protein
MRYQLASQPLNLIKMQEPLSVDVGTNMIPRKKYLGENPAPLVITSQVPPPPPPETVIIPMQQQQQQQQQEKPSQLVIPTSHPQNPEGSIIKDLLLNSKNFGAIDGEGGDGTYTCPTCKIQFRGADILKYHLICHCGDEQIISRSAPMSPTSNATSPYYPRSSSEKFSPSSLSNIAQSQLRTAISPRTPSSLQKLAKSSLKIPKPKPENIIISPAISAIKSSGGAIVKNPLPSPGPLLGNTRLIDKRVEDEYNNAKKQKLDYATSSSASSLSSSSGSAEKKVSPFFDMKFMHDKSTPSKNFPSGGGFMALEGSEMQSDEISPNNMMRQGLSGGIALEVPVKKEHSLDPPPITPKLIVTITPTLAPTLTTNTSAMFTSSRNHFQFPTVYNPLTLPLLSTQQAAGTQSIVHGGRVIPYVPGIPGPNTMNVVNKNDLPPPPVPIKDKRLNSPSMKQQNGIIVPPPREISPMSRPNGVLSKKKSFNFARIADNIDPNRSRKSPEENETMEEDSKPAKPAFLRPTSLPLKPGTFTPKQHHGITPTANTLPLISPETPRPSKSCVQLYLNGHAYTYLGLKSSTKPFYCTVNKPQPSYIQNQHKLSMYSNWQIYNGNNPNIFDLSPFAAMSLYDSRQRPSKYAIADERKELVSLVEMQTIKITSAVVPTNYQIQVPIKDEQSPTSATNSVVTFESNEEYTYIRGRGRGKYICQECGIRCKKPSMLKKHIRTHTDLRPYTCSYCEFR